MMVLGPKHVGAFLMCKFYEFYIYAVVGIIIEFQTEFVEKVKVNICFVHKLFLF